MQEWLRILAAAALVWAVVAMARQVVVARGAGRKDLSQARGNATRGLIYNFTAAMAPSHKESARLHPFKFGVGVVLHIGVVLALLDLLLLILLPGWAAAIEPFIAPLVTLGLLAGLYLCLRRSQDTVLLKMSSPDDFIAIAAVMCFLLLSTLHGLGLAPVELLLGFAILLFVYMPFGKLKHAAFFFAARADFGRRMGHRGSYPMTAGEQSHVR